MFLHSLNLHLSTNSSCLCQSQSLLFLAKQIFDSHTFFKTRKISSHTFLFLKKHADLFFERYFLSFYSCMPVPHIIHSHHSDHACTQSSDSVDTMNDSESSSKIQIQNSVAYVHEKKTISFKFYFWAKLFLNFNMSRTNPSEMEKFALDKFFIYSYWMKFFFCLVRIFTFGFVYLFLVINIWFSIRLSHWIP